MNFHVTHALTHAPHPLELLVRSYVTHILQVNHAFTRSVGPFEKKIKTTINIRCDAHMKLEQVPSNRPILQLKCLMSIHMVMNMPRQMVKLNAYNIFVCMTLMTEIITCTM